MEFLKKFKPADYIIIALVILIVLTGALVFFKKKDFSNLPGEKEVTINFAVFFRGITLSSPEAPFKPGEDAFITIRNVPYTKLKIKNAGGQPRMTVIPAAGKEGGVVVPDASTPDLYDCVVVLEDKAKKTDDGYVAGGNKIKMGIPVVIEGPTYKYSGTVSGISEVAEQDETPAETQSPVTQAIQEETSAK